LIDSPDIAQTIAVTCLGLGIRCDIDGLHTLKVKETDRLIALKNEITKLGAKISITNKSLSIYPTKSINKNINIFTYDDHRMAMSFAPLAVCADINILNAEVVNKSYPNFWNDIKSIGIEYSII
jgi:3-phosphoshikimate 1-carboxyvinyltransferase